jgi:endonuclease III
MRKERTPDQTAEVALRAADESVAAVVDKLRRQAREETLATILAAGLYPEGAATARRMGFDEDHVHDLLMEAASISDDDQGMVSESVWNLESLLELV